MSERSQVRTWIATEVELDDGPGRNSAPSMAGGQGSGSVDRSEAQGGSTDIPGAGQRPSASRPRSHLLAGAVITAAVVVSLAVLAFTDRSTAPGEAAQLDSVETPVGDSSTDEAAPSNGDGSVGSSESDSDTANSVAVDSQGADSQSSASQASEEPTSSLSMRKLFADEANARSQPAYGVFASGRLSLLGTWPSRATAEAIADRASLLVGPQNVTIDAEFASEGTSASNDPVDLALFVDEPLTVADDSGRLADPATEFLLQSAGALMAIVPDARVTLIVPGLEDEASDQSQVATIAQVEELAATLEQVGVPAGQISVEPSAVAPDSSVAPFVMLSGLFG